jgi:hypothetical protein
MLGRVYTSLSSFLHSSDVCILQCTNQLSMLLISHLSLSFHNLKLTGVALFATAASAFTPAGPSTRGFAPLQAAQVDDVGNNVAVKNLLQQVENTRLLSKVAQARNFVQGTGFWYHLVQA